MAGEHARYLREQRMEPLDYWRLCDHLTLVQAALLILDIDPAGVEEYLADWEPHKLPTGYSAVYAALGAAVQSGRLNHPFGIKIRVADLREWLVERRVKSKFFFPDGVPARRLLESKRPVFLAKALRRCKGLGGHPRQSVSYQGPQS